MEITKISCYIYGLFIIGKIEKTPPSMIAQHTIDMTRTWIFTCKNDASDTNSLTDSLAKDGAPCTNLVFAALVVSFLLIKVLPFQKKKK